MSASHSRAMAVVSALVLTLAVLVVVFATPAVSTFEIQRRDRLPPSARFVTFAYQFVLNRAPDAAGLASYQRMFDAQGPRAVAAALTQSQEFQDRTASGPGAVNPDAMPDQVVAAYQASVVEQQTSVDTLGRVGFVLVLAACLAAVGLLRRAALFGPAGRDVSRIYLPARYIVVLFAALALMAWVADDLLLASFGPRHYPYVEWLFQIASAVGARGLANVWTPYPQGAQDLVVALAGVANVVASSVASDVWTSFSVFRTLFQFVFLLLPSVLGVAVVAALGRRIAPDTATLAALGAAFSLAPMYYGFLSANVTDPLPVLLGLAAVWCLADRRYTMAGLAIGTGAALKLFPVFLLPVAIVFVTSWTARLRVVLATLVVALVVFVPPALANFDMFLSPIRWQSGRPTWESLYAFVNWVSGAPHEFRAPYFADIGFGDGFGWVFWGITPRLSALLVSVPPGPLRWEHMVSFGGTILVVVTCFAARARSVLSLVRWCLFSLAGFMFWSTGWSPQYELYVVPLALLAVQPAGVALAAALLLEGLTLLEYPVLMQWAYFYGGSVVWIMWAALLGRYIVLAWLCVYVVQAEGSIGALVGRVRRASALVVSLGTCWRRPAVVSAAAVLLLASPPATAAAAAGCDSATASLPLRAAEAGSTQADWSIAGGHFFTQASDTSTSGFAIVDDDSAKFWSEFQRLGGWVELGYPASRRFVWHGLLSQATQRAVLQWSPVTGRVEFANVLDLMHDQALDDDLMHFFRIPPPTEVDEAGLPYETIAAKRLEWLEARPSIKNKYCQAPGGADPLVLWGLPTSVAVNDAGRGTVYVVRTQRAAFQEWVDGAPWAAPGQVTVVLSGDLAKDFALLPAEATVPETAPPSAAGPNEEASTPKPWVR